MPFRMALGASYSPPRRTMLLSSSLYEQNSQLCIPSSSTRREIPNLKIFDAGRFSVAAAEDRGHCQDPGLPRVPFLQSTRLRSAGKSAKANSCSLRELRRSKVQDGVSRICLPISDDDVFGPHPGRGRLAASRAGHRALPDKVVWQMSESNRSLRRRHEEEREVRTEVSAKGLSGGTHRQRTKEQGNQGGFGSSGIPLPATTYLAMHSQHG